MTEKQLTTFERVQQLTKDFKTKVRNSAMFGIIDNELEDLKALIAFERLHCDHNFVDGKCTICGQKEEQ